MKDNMGGLDVNQTQVSRCLFLENIELQKPLYGILSEIRNVFQ